MKAIYKIFGIYLIILFLLIISGLKAFSQITIIHFNAEWNDKNKVEWVNELTDCKIKYTDISINVEFQKKYEIVVVPTIIIFSDGEEVKRYQADISFTMKATREELQEFINETIMNKF